MQKRVAALFVGGSSSNSPETLAIHENPDMNCDTRRQVRTVGTRTRLLLLQEDETQVFVRQTGTPEKRATHCTQSGE